MSHGDDGNGTDGKRPPKRRPDDEECAVPAGWLDALNSFMERALKADIDTGC